MPKPTMFILEMIAATNHLNTSEILFEKRLWLSLIKKVKPQAPPY